MANFNCTDINGLNVTQFVFNENGTVSGIVSTGSTTTDPNINSTTTTYVGVDSAYKGMTNTTTSPISQQCCNALNFIWDSNTNTCYWSQTCDLSPDVKVILGSTGNAGAFFQVEDNESCILEVQFDYLFEFDCNTLRECLIEASTESQEIANIQTDINTLSDNIVDIDIMISSLTQELQTTETNCEVTSSEMQADLSANHQACDELYASIVMYQNLLSGNITPEQQSTYQATLTGLLAQYEQCQASLNEQYAAYTQFQQECTTTTTNIQQTIDQYTQQKGELTTQVDLLNQLLASGTTGTTNCLSMFQNLDVSVTLDVVTNHEPQENVSYINPQTLSQVYEAPLYQVDNIVDYWSGNCNTGIYVTGNTDCISQLSQCIIYNLSADCSVFSACTLNSDWLHHTLTISDVQTLSGITNQEIKLGFKINNTDCDFSLLIDNIQINKVCTIVDRTDVFITKCPGFELERVVDNKKSWVVEDSKTDRDFELSMRETEYDINHHKLAINTKEVDLDVCPANAIETDVWCYIKDNESILNCSTGTTSATSATTICEGCLTGYCGDIGLNINTLLTTEISAITTVKEFDAVLTTELIDVKSRKVISAYPTLRVLYERYRNGFQANPSSSAFDYYKIDKFVKLVGDYWVDLIEQVIPSTTIWGSTYKYRNTIFDTQKFKYKKYTLKPCGKLSGVQYPSPTLGLDFSIGVEITDISGVEYGGPECLAPEPILTECMGVLIEQIDHGSEFIGTINIMNTPTTGDTGPIVECDLIINAINDKLGVSVGTGSMTAVYAGGTAPYTFSWTYGNLGGQFSGWTITSGTEVLEEVQVSGPSFTPVIGDTLCLSVTMTDSNHCVYGLSKCWTYDGKSF